MFGDPPIDETLSTRDWTKPPKRLTDMRRFVLRRHEDMLGISGTGIIAEGVWASDGKAVLFWKTQYKSIGVYNSIEEMEAIHCHGGTTEIGWIDIEPERDGD